MSTSIVLSSLPAPGSISIGQLITDPSHNDFTSFGSSDSANFNTIRKTQTAQNFLLNSTLQHRKVYFVAGISHQKFTNITTTSASASEPFTRPDSAVDLDVDSTSDTSISALILLPIRCRIGYATEPHAVDDVGYSWSYHKLNDEGMQLSIGLGRATDRSDSKKDTEGSENGSDMDWGYGSEDDEDGLGGF